MSSIVDPARSNVDLRFMERWINSRQKAVLLIGCLLFTLSCIFVPWKISPTSETHIQNAPMGYESIFSPPSGVGAVPDKPRIVLTWAAIAGVIGALFILNIGRRD